METLATVRITRGLAAATMLVLSITCGDPVPPNGTSFGENSLSSNLLAAASITVRLGSSSINVGGTTNATAIVTSASGRVLNRKVAWSSSNPSVAIVDQSTRTVTGIGAGTADIIATWYGTSGRSAITVGPISQVPVASVTVTIAASPIGVGATTTATAVLRDASNNTLAGRSVIWLSSDPTAVSVNAAGVVTGVGAGTAYVVALSEGVTGHAWITITAPAATSLIITAQPTDAVSGANFTTQPLVHVRDASNSLVTGSSAAITASIASGSGALSGTTTVNAEGGIATFASLAITGTGPHALTFTSNGLTQATSNSFTVSSAAPPTGDPQPGGGDVVVLDFRAGGNKNMQACATLACVVSGVGGAFGSLGFTTNFDGSGTHALVFPWVRNNGQSSCTGNVGSQQDMFAYIQPNIPGPAEIFFQYKIWMGRTPSGGGTGTVGSYTNTSTDPQAPGGHKWFVLFRTFNNDARMTAQMSPTLGKFITTPYAAYSGPAAWADGSIGETHFFGADVATPWIPDLNLNRASTLTFRVKSESAANARNGEMTIWANGVLIQHGTGLYTSPFGATEWQVGGPTWICPPQDQTHYIWDMVIWRK